MRHTYELLIIFATPLTWRPERNTLGYDIHTAR